MKKVEIEKLLVPVVNDIIYFSHRVRVPSEKSKSLFADRIIKVFQDIWTELQEKEDATTTDSN